MSNCRSFWQASHQQLATFKRKELHYRVVWLSVHRVTGKASPLKWHRVYKSFGILIKLVIPLEIWDAFGMKAVKSFGILVEGYRGVGRVIAVIARSKRQDWDTSGIV
jgi:hypothetical protein